MPHIEILSRDCNFAVVNHVKEPCWFRNENSRSSCSAGLLVMNFRMAVTGHKTWPFMKGNTTWCVHSPWWIILDHWIERTKSWPVDLKSFLRYSILSTDIFDPQNTTETIQQYSPNQHSEYSDLNFYTWAKYVMATLGFWKRIVYLFSLFTHSRTDWMIHLSSIPFGRLNSRWIIQAIFRYWLTERQHLKRSRWVVLRSNLWSSQIVKLSQFVIESVAICDEFRNLWRKVSQFVTTSKYAI